MQSRLLLLEEENQIVAGFVGLHYCTGSMHKDGRLCTWERGPYQALEMSVLGQTRGLFIELICCPVWATMIGSKMTKMGLNSDLNGFGSKLNGPKAQ